MSKHVGERRYDNLTEAVVVVGILVIWGTPLLILGFYVCAARHCNDTIPTLAVTSVAIVSQFMVLRQWRQRRKTVLIFTSLVLFFDVILFILNSLGVLTT